MVYKRYYSPFEEKHTEIKREPPPTSPVREEKKAPQKNLFNMEYDDLILIGLIIILLSENKENRDTPLILAIAFLFIIQYIDAD